MIRKVLFFIALCYTVLWFSGAYLAKGRVVSLLGSLQSDNTKISYDKISVSGFPTKWRISIHDPKVTFIDRLNSKQISTRFIDCLFDLALTKTTLIMDHEIEQNQIIEQISSNYKFKSPDNPVANVKFTKPLYKITSLDSISTILRSFNTNINQLVGISDEEEFCELTNVSVQITKSDSETELSNLVKVHLKYTGDEGFFNFTQAELNLDTLIINNDLNKHITLNEFALTIDSASAALTGELALTPTELPQGTIDVRLDNYEEALERILPTSFNTPKSILKRMIAKASASDIDTIVSTEDRAVQFNITFSADGIAIGEINLEPLEED